MQDRHRDRVLVHVEPEVDGRFLRETLATAGSFPYVARPLIVVDDSRLAAERAGRSMVTKPCVGGSIPPGGTSPSGTLGTRQLRRGFPHPRRSGRDPTGRTLVSSDCARTRAVSIMVG